MVCQQTHFKIRHTAIVHDHDWAWRHWKTYVVNAVKAFMSRYSCTHLIRFLAPTGSAASLIDGMTIHQGLGIKIKTARHGKANRDVGESSEDYTVLVSCLRTR